MIGQEIKKIRPYFRSLREIGDKVSLDLKISMKWSIDDYEKTDKATVRIQDTDKKSINLISIIGEIDEDNEIYEIIFNIANEIIEFNLEQEEKSRLLRERMSELEKLYKEKSRELEEIFSKTNVKLDELRKIKITKDEIDEFGVVGIGNKEGQEGDRDTQEEND